MTLRRRPPLAGATPRTAGTTRHVSTGPHTAEAKTDRYSTMHAVSPRHRRAHHAHDICPSQVGSERTWGPLRRVFLRVGARGQHGLGAHGQQGHDAATSTLRA
eukprot:3936449-Rhodomonas_salina.3